MNYSEEIKIVFMMAEQAKTKDRITDVKKTIISIVVYEEDELENLHQKINLPLKILDSKINIELHERKVKRNTII